MRYLVADLAGLLLFSAVGAAFHGAYVDLGLVGRTFLPLALTWLAVGSLLGTYRAPGWRTFFLTWVVAVPAGILLRQLLQGRLLSPATFSFLLAGTAASGVVLVLIRLALQGWTRAGFRSPGDAG